MSDTNQNSDERCHKDIPGGADEFYARKHEHNEHCRRMTEAHDVLVEILLAHNDPSDTKYRMFDTRQISALDYLTYSDEIKHFRSMNS